MKHNMHLKEKPFNQIKNETKTIELRLNDEKRRLIKIGDLIEFSNLETNEIIDTEVINIYHYDTFEELYKNFDKISLGYNENEEKDPNDMDEYYPKDKQLKYGVIGIKINVLKK